ncbi:hypoxanthine phosphoribosyltransferase [Dictyoglomus thermophilum]|uniref:Hypoxanthine phosphoribosyltransferase n=1 Tax=Dictyoglomus thermophilum (strain ATCC 35947 / DSM 3960 / H-6-12) TaxID=309799 RepID=B5YBT7_DICT6|nr:hypoxanthine phosphoribosyltransferase [Dictyoglomus thermophilum]ACI18708.1 hypoxanthine phosphoribosyltransferase [Dictyoglomus thermophilum H-6-12]
MEKIGKILFTKEEIEKRIKELGEEISKDYKDKDLVLACILKGAVYFAVDLTRNLSIPFVLDFISILSYGSSRESQGIVRIIKDLDVNIYKKDLLIIEDIVDTGLTLSYLIRNLQAKNPSSIKVCTLLDCPGRRIIDITVDYKGFEIPNYYVIGYGLDYKEKYRNLPYIAVLEEF